MTTQDQLLKLLLGGSEPPNSEQFKELIQKLDNHRILAKVFLLEGTPVVFANSPMKYVIFREQVANRFRVGSQDVCIVGSAKLGFSPTPYKYGTTFEENSDVDVVIISNDMFDHGSRELFKELNYLRPHLHEFRHLLEGSNTPDQKCPTVALKNWKKYKEAIRNFVFQNFNPGLLSPNNSLKQRIFEDISSTSGLFLALEPPIFVSKIRARIFRTWLAAEDYYSNTLRDAKRVFEDQNVDVESEDGPELNGDSPDDI